MANKILLVDDEEDILEFLSYNLAQEGYEVGTAENGIKAIEEAGKMHPDLILIDVMMPGMDGIEACKEIRKQQPNVIIAFLTARNEDYSQIAGLDAGADDYITKPIRPRVLVSRVKALLRRKSEEKKEEQNQGDLHIDHEKFIVIHRDKEFNLPKKEFELLALLASRPGKVFNRDEILSRVWGSEIIVGDRTIDVHIRKLREKFGSEYIQTVKGVGYKYHQPQD